MEEKEITSQDEEWPEKQEGQQNSTGETTKAEGGKFKVQNSTQKLR